MAEDPISSNYVCEILRSLLSQLTILTIYTLTGNQVTADLETHHLVMTIAYYAPTF